MPDRAADAGAGRAFRAGLERAGGSDEELGQPREIRDRTAVHGEPGGSADGGAGEGSESRGLLEDTLVIWTTEFGRMPFSQGQNGRDHNGGTFVTWLAGGGLKPGVTYGESDEWAWKAQVPTYCYDLHATVLYLLGHRPHEADVPP